MADSDHKSGCPILALFARAGAMLPRAGDSANAVLSYSVVERDLSHVHLHWPGFVHQIVPVAAPAAVPVLALCKGAYHGACGMRFRRRSKPALHTASHPPFANNAKDGAPHCLSCASKIKDRASSRVLGWLEPTRLSNQAKRAAP